MRGESGGPRWEAPPATTGPIITSSAATLSPGRLQIQPYWYLGLTRGNFSGSWQARSAGGNFVSLTIPVQVNYGLVRNLELQCTAPYVHNWAGNVDQPGPQGPRSADFGGLGDITLLTKYQFLKESAQCPTVTGIMGFTFPTGHHARLNPPLLGTDSLGGGAWAMNLGVNLSKWVKPFLLYANLWYGLALEVSQDAAPRPAAPILSSMHQHDQIIFNLAAEWVLTPCWVLQLEFYSTWEVGSLLTWTREPAGALLGVLPGVEFILNPRWSCALGASLDLAGKNTRFHYTPVFTVLFNY